MPAGTAAARVSGIESEGARVTVIPGDYDQAVALAASTASPDRLVVSDTSWPGYEQIPLWISDGYSTIFAELDGQLAESGDERVDAFVVPVGVGALAKAALDHWPSGLPDGPLRIAVEPTAADCLYRSLVAGEPVTVPGPHESIMAGMNCGTLSMVAWPAMRDRFDWCVTIDDRHAADAMRALADGRTRRRGDRRRLGRRTARRFGAGRPRSCRSPHPRPARRVRARARRHSRVHLHRGRHRSGQLRGDRRRAPADV